MVVVVLYNLWYNVNVQPNSDIQVGGAYIANGTEVEFVEDRWVWSYCFRMGEINCTTAMHYINQILPLSCN